jgi:hypothetical protein
MNPLTDLQQRREALLAKIGTLRRMRRGTLTTTRPARKRKDGTVQHAGPYYKHQCWIDGRNHTAYLSAEEFERLQPEVKNYQTLKQLTEELARVNEQLTRLEDDMPAAVEKKTSLPRRPKTN